MLGCLDAWMTAFVRLGRARSATRPDAKKIWPAGGRKGCDMGSESAVFAIFDTPMDVNVFNGLRCCR
ncbi:hypothetical protein, partial [Bifidobacterium scardovii]|uniref:hypothetical protein n=1 Tax=Bifidobacterium scardovii TaxID=158787 RepID=UPI0019D360EB